MLKSFEVTVTVTQKIVVEVEADSPEKAARVARNQVADGWTVKPDEVTAVEARELQQSLLPAA